MKMRYHTVQCSRSQCYKPHYVQNQFLKLKTLKKHKTSCIKYIKTAGAVYTATGSESTEREQTPYSTHLNRVYSYK